jgi:outer membrane receptor for ferrienterochelin and colicin
LDYYIHENLKLKIGSGFIRHENNPAVKQSRFISEGSIDTLENLDDGIISNEAFGFLESNLQLHKNLILTPGFYYVNYSSGLKNYNSLQPRIQALWTPHEAIQFSGGYTKSTQFVHLLANSGLGLPSELWVPSNESLPPQNLHHFTIGLKWNVDSFAQMSFSIYNKEYSGLIEYIEPVDLFLNLISPDGNPPVLNNPRDWQEKTEKGGKGNAQGVELSMTRSTQNYQLWTSFHYGRSYRQFDKLNEGNRFITRYDKPLNINCGASLKLNDKWQIGANWVYSSGQPFTIADEGFIPLVEEILPGVKFLNPSSKNNYRMPAFHQLTLSSDFRFIFNKLHSKLSFGVYNVYNRLNPFYIYSTRSLSNNILFKKVSLFPVLPQINFEIRF